MSIAELEIRLSNPERKVDQFVEIAGASASSDMNAWIDQVHGTFQDHATYRRAARLGRAWRKAQHAGRPTRPRKAAGA